MTGFYVFAAATIGTFAVVIGLRHSTIRDDTDISPNWTDQAPITRT